MQTADITISQLCSLFERVEALEKELGRFTKSTAKSSVATMLTIQEVSDNTGVSYNHIRQLCLTNKITHIKTGKKYLINWERFLEYLNCSDKGEE